MNNLLILILYYTNLMLKNINTLLFISLITMTFNGCKKGENDPSFSLLSRKARLTGQWEMTTMESTVVTSKTGSNNISTTTQSFADGKLTTTYTDTNGTQTLTRRYVTNYEFQKNGKFNILIEDYYETGTKRTEQNIAGTWFFNTKNKELEQKNKEFVSMNITSNKTISYYENGTAFNIDLNANFGLSELSSIQLNRLTNKELILTLDEAISTQFGTGNNASTSFHTKIGVQTFTKK
ncbi:MAG: hypothetical protein KJ941_07470 [Bacteroidetes bacterium]|nr:hypothetical protein [Bacteroidota bacterium]